MPVVSEVRSQARDLARVHRADPRALARHALSALSEGGEQLAFELFRAMPTAVKTLTPRQIQSMLARLHDWNSTDCFGCFVSGVAWRQGGLTTRHILGWTNSPNRWIRRAALVSTVPLNLPARGATALHGEAAKTQAICERLIDDRDDMVVKALSWALRVLARKNPKAVSAFLQRHGERLAPRVLRETNNKLKTGLKAGLRSGTKARIKKPRGGGRSG